MSVVWLALLVVTGLSLGVWLFFVLDWLWMEVVWRRERRRRRRRGGLVVLGRRVR